MIAQHDNLTNIYIYMYNNPHFPKPGHRERADFDLYQFINTYVMR